MLPAATCAASLIAAVVAAGCGGRAREADPARVTALFAKMFDNVPTPGGVPTCEYSQLTGGATVTRRTLSQLAGKPTGDQPETADYVNPSELDSPAARTLIDSADDGERRRAAAELLAAPFFLVYYNDAIDVPMALGHKDFNKAYGRARALRYDPTGRPVCFLHYVYANSPAKQQWAIEHSDRAQLSIEVRDEIRRDLRAQLLTRIANLARPEPRAPHEIADDRYDRQR